MVVIVITIVREVWIGSEATVQFKATITIIVLKIGNPIQVILIQYQFYHPTWKLKAEDLEIQWFSVTQTDCMHFDARSR